jgi:hypothetical protein
MSNIVQQFQFLVILTQKHSLHKAINGSFQSPINPFTDPVDTRCGIFPLICISLILLLIKFSKCQRTALVILVMHYRAQFFQHC